MYRTIEDITPIHPFEFHAVAWTQHEIFGTPYPKWDIINGESPDLHHLFKVVGKEFLDWWIAKSNRNRGIR